MTSPTITGSFDVDTPMADGDSRLVFSGLTVSDPDLGESDFSVWIRVDEGTQGNIYSSNPAYRWNNNGSYFQGIYYLEKLVGGAYTTAGITLEDVNAALDSATFKSADYGDSDSDDTAVFTVVVNDSPHVPNSLLGAQYTSGELTITEENDAPVNIVPGAQDMAQNGTIVFSNANNNALSVDDVDLGSPFAGRGTITVTITAPDGVINVNPVAVTNGNGTNSVTITGYLYDVNQTLQGLSYKPPAGVTGFRVLTLTSDDLGNTPAPAQQTTSEITIRVGTVNAAPVINDLDLDNGAVFTEDGPPVAFDVGTPATVTDDNANLGGGTLTATFVNDTKVDATDHLVVVPGASISVLDSNIIMDEVVIGTITVNGLNGTLTISLSSHATPVRVTELLRAIGYNNPSDTPTAGFRDVKITVTDGAGANAESVSINYTSVQVTPINEAPVLTSSPTTTINYTEAAAPVALMAGVSMTDEESSLGFAGSRLKISIPNGGTNGGALTLKPGSDFVVVGNQLRLNEGPNQYVIGEISGYGTSSVLASSMTSDATLARVNDLFDEFVFATTATSTRFSGNHTITLEFNDFGNGGTQPTSQWVSVTQTLAYTAVNSTPVLDLDTGTGGTGVASNYTEADPAALLVTNPAVSDIDSANFAGGNLTVTITGATADDRLTIVSSDDFIYVMGNQLLDGTSGEFMGNFSGGTGTNPLVINLNTRANPSNVALLLKQIAYHNVSATPGPSREITFSLDDGDGGASTAAAIATLTIQEIVDPTPTSTNIEGDVASFVDGPTPVRIDVGGNATIADADSANFNGGSLTVSIDNVNTAEDQLGFDSFSFPVGSFSPGTVSVYSDAASDWVQIGTYTGGGAGGDDLVFTFDADATPAAVQELVRALTYVNSNELAPDTTQRGITLTLVDAPGGNTLTINTEVNVSLENDRPNFVLSNIGPSVALDYAEDAPATVIAPLAELSDIDSADFNTGTLTVSFETNGESADQLGIQSQGTGAGQISVSGSDVLYQNVVIGTFTGGTNGTNLVVTFDADATPPAAQALVRAITYHNTSQDPSPLSRTVAFVVTDGDGGSAPANAVVHMTAANDAPSGTSSTIVAVEDSFRLLAEADFGFSDADGVFAGVTITGVTGGAIYFDADGSAGIGEPELVILPQSYTEQDLIDGKVSFRASPHANGTAVGTIAFAVTDNGGATDPSTNTLTVDASAVPDAPVAQNDGDSTTEAATRTIAVLANDTDPDGTQVAIEEIDGQAVSAGQTITLTVSQAKVTLNNDGTITYDPKGRFDTLTAPGSGAVNTSAQDVFTYKLVGGTATANVTVTVGGLASAEDIYRGDGTVNVITGTPQRDIFHVQQGGNDTIHALAGNDTIYFGAAFTAADTVNGGEGIDSIIFQGNYGAGLTFGTGTTSNISGVDTLSLAPGDFTDWGDMSNQFYDYNFTMLDANAAAGGLLKINGFYLRGDEDLTVNASAEADARYIIIAGQGVDNLTGGGQGDVFVFGDDGRFGNSDVVNGGGGYDSIYLRGDYALDFTSGAFLGGISGIESITLGGASDTQFVNGGDGEFDYSIVWKDSMLANGATITINGGGLAANETMAFNGANEGLGHFRLFGGSAADTLTGGGGNDLIYGGLGSDQLRGNGGADTFRYQATNESPIGLANADKILDFTHGVDKIDLSVIDAKVAVPGDQAFTFIGAATFSAAGPISAGQLRAVQTDALTNTWQVHGDTDGNGVADFVLQVIVDPLQSLTTGDFIL